MRRYNLKEYSDNYSKTSGRLRKYYRDEPVLADDGDITNVHAAGSSASFNAKTSERGNQFIPLLWFFEKCIL